ncbi:hypothetical protein GCM10027087_46100 [Paractinoplanes abujensis]
MPERGDRGTRDLAQQVVRADGGVQLVRHRGDAITTRCDLALPLRPMRPAYVNNTKREIGRRADGHRKVRTKYKICPVSTRTRSPEMSEFLPLAEMPRRSGQHPCFTLRNFILS